MVVTYEYDIVFDKLVKSFVEKYYKYDDEDISEYYIIGE
jgi:hypothetical protein